MNKFLSIVFIFCTFRNACSASYRARICIEEFSCILRPSRINSTAELTWKRQTLVDKSEQVINSGSRFSFDQNLTMLKIEEVSKRDEGVYTLTAKYKTINNADNRTIITTELFSFQLSVKQLNELFYPTYPGKTKLQMNREAREYAYQVGNLFPQLALVYTDHAQSFCGCGLSNKGFMYNLKMCFLKVNSSNKAYDHDRYLGAQMKALIRKYSNSISCESPLVPYEFNRLLNSFNVELKSYQVFDQCVCAPNKTNEEEKRFRFPNSKLIMARPNENILLKCDTRWSQLDQFDRFKIHWEISDDNERLSVNRACSGNERICMDPWFRLNIRLIRYSDPTVYTCFYENDIRIAYVIRVTTSRAWISLAKSVGIGVFAVSLTAVIILQSKDHD